MMRIAAGDKPGVSLIVPPSPFLADERVFPFLGPLKVAAELRRHGYAVDVLDLAGFGNYEDIVRTYAQSTSHRCFGLTATTPQLPAAIGVLSVLREACPSATVMLGGPHATLTHAAYLRDQRQGVKGRGTIAFEQIEAIFDKLVVGDGERAVFEAIDPLNTRKVVDAGSLSSQLFMRRGELDLFSVPARDLIDLDSYHYEIDGHRAFSVIGQLGCPFECGFCGGRDAPSFRVARSRAPGSIVAEIEQVVRASIDRGRPFSGVMFYDDELNVHRGSLEALCQGLIALQERLGMSMRFRGFIKAELFTSEQARLMHQAGFRILLSGVESGSDTILKTMRKHTTRAINTRCLELAHAAGLQFKALMSLGHPGESDDTAGESVDWVLKTRPDDVDWTIITEYPGSPYFDHSVYDAPTGNWVYTEPRTGNRLWSRSTDYCLQAEYYKGIPGDYVAYVWTDYLSSAELVRLRDTAEAVTREALGLAPITSVSAAQFEHSMGQSLPLTILRRALPEPDLRAAPAA
ncbi:MAG TPA: radical SAM protein [Chloroflexota bacterium]|nr:radical SAM protein [Chloroflexota bacterium]